MAGLNFTKNKITNVGVAITLDNRMEVVVVDYASKKVLDYRTVPLEYNYQSKEIADYTAFATALKSILFDEMHLVAKNINLVLTLPSIHLATAQIPSAQTEPGAVESILATYAQDSYLFKRHEPVVAYQPYSSSNKENMPVIYSAMQESVASQIKEILVDDIGIENFSINNPYASIINALAYCGQIEAQVNSNEVWNFVQITNNGFTLFQMVGTKITEINDMPLPLKTFAPEEIYESMALSLQNNLSIYPAASLYVLSRTDLLSAQILLQSMELRGDVAFLENNKFTPAPFIDIDSNVDSDLAKIISVEVVGSAITTNSSPIKLCYLSNKDAEEEVYGYVNLFGQDVALNNTFISKVIIFLIVAVLAIGGIAYWGASSINKVHENNVNTKKAKKSALEAEITQLKGGDNNIEKIIADISQNNEASALYFNSISVEIPSNMWLTYFYTDSSGALDIKGDTSSVGSIYSFFRSVKDSVPESTINLSKLEYNDIDAIVSAAPQGDKTITFEISNSSYNKVIEMMAAKVPTGEGGEAGKEGSKPEEKTGSEGLPDLPEIEPPTN